MVQVHVWATRWRFKSSLRHHTTSSQQCAEDPKSPMSNGLWGFLLSGFLANQSPLRWFLRVVATLATIKKRGSKHQAQLRGGNDLITYPDFTKNNVTRTICRTQCIVRIGSAFSIGLDRVHPDVFFQRTLFTGCRDKFTSPSGRRRNVQTAFCQITA